MNLPQHWWHSYLWYGSALLLTVTTRHHPARIFFWFFLAAAFLNALAYTVEALDQWVADE